MLEKILLALLSGGNIVIFIKYLIERHDRKKERAEDKAEAHAEAEKAENNELCAIKDRLTKLEKDGIRTQLLLMILLRPEEKKEIMTLGQHYFSDLNGNWYMTDIFNKWLETEGHSKPEWFEAKK